VRSPFSDDPDDLLYRTGDIGRYELDGSLTIAGRLDDELKINGVRVNPAEVAARLDAHPDVAHCAVVPSHAPGDAPALAAFVVTGDGADLKGTVLRAYLREQLPAAFVPARIHVIAAIPLSPNGKIDRAALLCASTPGAAPASPPQTDTERVIAMIWSHLLEVDAVGREDSFFDLGGHSLLEMSMVTELRATTGVKLPLRSLFRTQTLAALAHEIDRLRAEEAVG
jgi:acyl carrier protein